MLADQWQVRWREGRIGFHQNQVTSALEKYWHLIDAPDASIVFVPFCGKSLDLLWLCSRRVAVLGVELSEVGVEAFFVENGITARRRAYEHFSEYSAPGLRLLCGDLHQMTPEMLGNCKAVFDRAALIAVAPELQPDYADKITQLTASGTKTLLVTLEYPQQEMRGPPYSTNSDQVHRLYAEHHDIEQLDRIDVWETDPLRKRGVTSLHETCYRLTRR